jgi:TonB-linked SusC/RagA family outer membrane protein
MQSIKVENKFITIYLAEESKNLNEVVVVGYGTMRKKDLTGAISQIDPSKIADQNPSTVQDLLRGTPGLQIGYDASAKGGGSILLRGQNSLYTAGDHNSPLIVLDGMAYNGEFSEINPDDIAQIDVLKDASSAAIYGAKAANGVIIITTKKGKVGKPVINVNANISANTKSAYRKVYDADGYIKYREDWYKATTYGNDKNGDWGYYGIDSGTPEGYYDNPDQLSQYGITQDQWATMGSYQLASGESYKSLYARRLRLNEAKNVFNNYLVGKTYDWYNSTFRSGFNQDYNANISGAADHSNYYLSFGYLNNQGVVEGNNYTSYRASMKIHTNITDWLKIGANVNFQNRSDGDTETALDNIQIINSPFAPIKDDRGNYVQYPMNGTSTNGGYNYWFDSQYRNLQRGYTVLNTIFNATITLPYDFTYQFNIEPRYQWYYNRYFLSAELPDSDPAARGVDRESSKNFDWNLNNILTWDHTFHKLHHVTVTLVQEAENHQYWHDCINARDITPTDALGLHNISGANMEESSFYANDTRSTAAAYLGRVFYGYKDRYMFTSTFRRDGYSAFGANNPWANFWSDGASWVFSEEPFIRKVVPWLDMGKLRISYGTNGNRSLSDTYLSYAELTNNGSMVYYNNGNSSIVKTISMDRLGNSDLQWEKTSSTNIGLDFSIFNQRLRGSIDWYFKKTHDMIMFQRLPNFIGFSNIITNLGQVNNSGIEISLNSTNILMRDFVWNTSLGFSYNKNTLKHIYYNYDENGKELDDTSNGWFIGKPIGEIWNYKVVGIWQKSEAKEAALVNQKPGDPKVENSYTGDDKILADGTHVPVYNDKDKQFLGTTNPPVYWNMRNDFTLWKNLTISISLYSYLGYKSTETYYLNQDNNESGVTYCYNQYKKEYWTPDNPSNKYARLNAVGPTGCTSVSKVDNRSFIRFDDISIGYTLPSEWAHKACMEKIRFTASIHNLCTIDNWKYGDPETGGLGTRIFNFGIKITL